MGFHESRCTRYKLRHFELCLSFCLFFGSVLNWIALVVALYILFAVSPRIWKEKPHGHTVGVLFRAAAGGPSVKQANFEAVPILENILIAHFALDIIRGIDSWVPKVFHHLGKHFNFLCNDDAFPLCRNNSFTPRQAFWGWRNGYVVWINANAAMDPRSDPIGRRLSPILKMELALKSYVWLSPILVGSDFQGGLIDAKVRSQLPFGRVTGKVDGILSCDSLHLGSIRLQQRRNRDYEGNNREARVEPESSSDPFVGVLWGYGVFLAGFVAGHLIVHFYDKRGRCFWILLGLSVGGMAAGLGWSLWLQWVDLKQGENREYSQPSQHDAENVSQKRLTPPTFSYYINFIRRGYPMANVLDTDKKIAVISALAEGSSIRSIERMTGIHRDTIMRLGVKVGQGCTALMDATMRDLPCNRLELDEIWGFVGKKDRNVRIGDSSQVGSVWTFCAIDAETKLVPAFKTGERNVATATAFVQDVANRMRNRVQISTDGLRAYVDAVEKVFGADVDYAQIVKVYGHEEASDNRRYSAPEFVSSEKKVIAGNPDERLISTSYVERLNATTRLHMRRLTRLTLAFSKKRENFDAAVGLHFAYYNFVKRHNTLRCTPAMAAGVTPGFWSVGDLVEAVA